MTSCIKPFEALGSDTEFWNHTLDAVAVFAAPGWFRVIGLQRTVPELTVVAAIIIAVIGLMDFGMPRRLWRYNKADAAALILTFVAVLVIGVTKGILIGAASTIVLHLWRTSRPHMAVVGRVPNTEHFRNVRRHEVQTLPHVLLLRIDESLYFANAKYIEDFVLCAAAERPQLRHLVLICNAVNFIDASALETLTDLRNRIQDAGIGLYLTEVKGPVMDRLADTEFLEQLGSERVFLSTEEVYEKLGNHNKLKQIWSKHRA